MTSIYSQAISTVIWLNDDVLRSGLGMPIAAATKHLIKDVRSLKNYQLQQLLKEVSTRDYTLQCLGMVLQHVYFSRLWIVEEVLLSSSIQILVEQGPLIAWEDLHCTYATVRKLLDYPPL